MSGSRRPVVVVTRADAPDAAFSTLLAARDIDVEWMPTIAVLPPEQPVLLDAALARLATFDWVVFTSGHAVDALVQHPGWPAAWQAAAGQRPRIAAVGPATADRLERHGCRADIQAADAGGSGLAKAIVDAQGGTLRDVRLLWPTSNIARRDFPTAVRTHGGALTEVVAYRTVPLAPDRGPDVLRDLLAHRIDAFVFFSPSAAIGLAAALGTGTLTALAGQALVASIGPATSAMLRSLGAPPDIEAHSHTAPALAASLAERLGS